MAESADAKWDEFVAWCEEHGFAYPELPNSRCRHSWQNTGVVTI